MEYYGRIFILEYLGTWTKLLIPSGVVKEGGRLPLRRGPRALQLEGVPFYELTEAGLVVASSIEEVGNRLETTEELHCINVLH